MYRKLESFKNKYGHCNVRYNYEPDPPLGYWVHNQRRAGKKNTLSEFR
jgi:hypothetical protein